MSTSAVETSPVEISFQPTSTAVRRINAVALSIPAIGCAIAVFAFVFIAVQRIWYPFELDWLESGMLEHVRRLTNGLPLYTEPSASFTQFPYAPLSFGIGALVSEIFGVHLSVMRGISFISTLATFALLFRMVRKETASVWAGWMAAGVYAATYALTATWFEVGKADSLFVFFTLLALSLARSVETKKSAVVAGFVMALAIMTKQTAIFAFAPAALYLIATRRWIGVSYAGAGLILAGGTTLILNFASHGWFNYYVWELLFQHELISTSKLDFWRVDLVSFWPVIPLVLLAAPQLLAKEKRWTTGFWVMTLGGLLAGAWSSRLHTGGTFNVLMPAFAGLALAVGIALGTLLEKPRRTLVILAAVALCTAQLWFLRYDLNGHVPSSTDRATGEQFIDWLKTVDGEVLVYSHPTYAVMAGKAPWTSEGGTEDVMRGKDERAKSILLASMATAIHEKRFGAIVLDSDQDTSGFPADWKNYYQRLPGSAASIENAWKPITLKTAHPTQVWVPIGKPAPPIPLPGR